MSAVAISRVVATEILVTEHIAGQKAANEFLWNLRRYAARGTELQELVELSTLKPHMAAAAWRRGFFGAIQKFCQSAQDQQP